MGETSQPLAIAPPLTSEFEPLDVISQCHLLGFYSVDAEKGIIVVLIVTEVMMMTITILKMGRKIVVVKIG